MSLPSGYKRVAYIQSSGTQYIDTEFIPNQDARIVLDAKFADVSGTISPLGERSVTTAMQYCFGWISVGGNLRSYNHTSYGVVATADTNRHVYELNKNATIIDGVTLATRTYTAFTAEVPVTIFACNDSGTVSFFSQMKLYSCQIYDNGTLVRNYVPCINSSGEIGLYDLANNKFYGNAGTGIFAAGELTFLEYIQSSGTQYVDTLYKPNNNTRVVVSARFPTTPTDNAAFFGARSANTNQMWAYYRPAATKFAYRYGNSSTNNTVSAEPTEWNVFDANKNVLAVGAASVTATTATFTSSYSLYIFGTNNAGSLEYPSNVQIGYFKIYDKGTLVRDYRPAQAGDEVGLWDAANEVFYPNAGTGVFTAGPVAQADTPENFEQILAVYLRWSAVDCDGYRIYRNGVLLGETTQTHYIDLTAEDNEDYSYTLTAYKGSAESDPATLTVYTRSGYFVYKPLVQSAFFQ